jgi:hypothetical protein
VPDAPAPQSPWEAAAGDHRSCGTAAVSPTVTLREEPDADVGRQRVSVTVDAPLIGRMDEYTGRFDHSVEPDDAGGTTP